MKMLIVEDEKDLRELLELSFQRKGYSVNTAKDGEEALELFFENSYSIIILDLNLPYIDGYEVLEYVRKEDKNIPILILSARGEVNNKVIGFDSGANDYVVKPFDLLELEARVRALIRRRFNTVENIILFRDGITYLDLVAKKVFHDKNEILLSNVEYRILEHLSLNKPCPVSTSELLDFLWNREDDDSDGNGGVNALKVHIYNIRQKFPVEIIKNMRGRGYYVE